MLGEPKKKIFLDLINSASKEELIWMNGYLNGVVGSNQPAETPTAATSPAVSKITILYGTETGNSKKLATDFAAKAKKNHINAKVFDMNQYRLTDLPKEEYLLAVVSTHGDGDAPEAAKKFYDHIHSNGFKLDRLKYSVLALGDTSYPLFCKTGEDVDIQFGKLGGKQIVPLQKCDIEYEEDANKWFNEVLKTLVGSGNGTTAVSHASPAAAPAHGGVSLKKTGKQTYEGNVLLNINLNDEGSNKETYHIEIAAEGLEYQCGDSIGIVPENPSDVVTSIISKTWADGNKIVTYKNEKTTIYELLKRKINIIHLTDRLVKQYADVTGHAIPAGRADLLDLVNKYPVKSPAQFEEILLGLNPIAPRLYTIASSPAAHEGEVHVIVAKDVYDVNGQTKLGLCSDYLSKLKANGKQKFFVQPNKRFRLPAEDKDIIMVGPGTGIAAFRSFLAERDATGASGRSWLFFGEQHFASDFLYQTEIQNWHETGVLTRVNVAFSRDQKEKIYVQHRMLEHGAELFAWLNGGASFYVCGKKDPTSVDVENTLLQIIEKYGSKSSEDAKKYLEQLKEEGRYEKDVY
ncbi:diflavin oxidoreductase [Ferruginibacter albus]|uniref:diflavin oxidoreductase n=1 Tax=Ferruginibacter albus TaxID=2875540 RepID=UPI001CC72AEC|nr:flavodoxin domain-containing protein [Ferruginibacter albus]UAY52984.1 flavodoxin domain-containing protein [Ferruginibacter albus]